MAAHKAAEKISRSVCGEMGTRNGDQKLSQIQLVFIDASFRPRVRIVFLSLSPSSDTVNKARENTAV